MMNDEIVDATGPLIESEISDEVLMAFVDGELDDPAVRRQIEQSHDLKERVALYTSTREMVRPLKTSVLEESAPPAMISLVREAAERQKLTTEPPSVTTGHQDDDSEETPGATIGDADQMAQKPGRPSLRSVTRMLHVSEAANRKTTINANDGTLPTSIRKPRKYVRPSLQAVSDMMKVIERAEVGFANVAACLFIAVCIHIVVPDGQDPWQSRYAELGHKTQLDTSNWSTSDEGTVEEFALLRFRSGNPNAGLESIVSRMLKGDIHRSLVTDADGTKTWVFLRGQVLINDNVDTLESNTKNSSSGTIRGLSATNAPAEQCVIGELIPDDGTNPEKAKASRFFRYCTAASSNRLTFLLRESLDTV